MCGGFAPLEGFLNREDYESVCSRARLSRGDLWPIPITLDVSEEFAESISPGDSIALRDGEGVMLAALHIESIWRPDKSIEAASVFSTVSTEHPGVSYLLEKTYPVYVGGKVEKVCMPEHYDFQNLRKTPGELKDIFAERGWERVIGFQTRNPIHRGHFEMIRAAAAKADARILIHPVVGLTKPGDLDHFTRVRCYQAIMPRFGADGAFLSLLPLAMRMAGPREALWHALIRKNYGCTHFIIGRDHSSPGKDSRGQAFYLPYAAHEYIAGIGDEVGITIVASKEIVYQKSDGRYIEIDQAKPGSYLCISGTETRSYLERGESLPEWMTFPEMQSELNKSCRPKLKQGLTVFLTGLPSAGKSTIAKILRVMLLEHGERPVSLLDGDEVRRHLSSELGFSKEDRALNIRRIAYVASQITNAGGAAICAPIAPYASMRAEAREIISEKGGFVLVFIDTPQEVCEARDRKGLYAKARAGLIRGFTGVDDPYEAPSDADIVIDTTKRSGQEAAQSILDHLKQRGYY